jgi:hypothetical protein
MRLQRSLPSFSATICMLLIASCASSVPSLEPVQSSLSREQMFARLPDRDTADCTGSLEFATDRRFEGESSCGRTFDGHSDVSMAAGTVCVYSSTVQQRSATDLIATGHFVCSDESRGSVRFQEERGNGPGTAVVSAEDGRVVTLNYE